MKVLELVRPMSFDKKPQMKIEKHNENAK